MPLEIEMKFRVDDFADIVQQLDKGSDPDESSEVDTYYAHPSVNFKETGEALRLRESDGEHVLCYKSGKNAGGVKAKREIETRLDSDQAQVVTEILEYLGFTESITVDKWRRTYRRRANGFQVNVCLDDVKDLGEFVEVEIVCEERNREDAERTVKRVAEKLGLSNPVTKGYAAMMHELKGQAR
jgi:adenylate cyclase class 2